MQRDPLGYVDGMNLMEYVGGNSVNWVDPFGLLLHDQNGNLIVILKDNRHRWLDKGKTRKGILVHIVTDKKVQIEAFLAIDGKKDGYNCHGYSFTDSKLLIDNKFVQTLIENEFIKKVEKTKGAIAIFRDSDNKIKHSAIFNGKSYNHKRGIAALEKNKSEAEIKKIPEYSDTNITEHYKRNRKRGSLFIPEGAGMPCKKNKIRYITQEEYEKAKKEQEEIEKRIEEALKNIPLSSLTSPQLW